MRPATRPKSEKFDVESSVSAHSVTFSSASCRSAEHTHAASSADDTSSAMSSSSYTGQSVSFTAVMNAPHAAVHALGLQQHVVEERALGAARQLGVRRAAGFVAGGVRLELRALDQREDDRVLLADERRADGRELEGHGFRIAEEEVEELQARRGASEPQGEPKNHS